MAAIVGRAMKEKELLGRRIKRLRTRLGLTQDALAENVEISAKYLSNIERGRENPTLDTLLRIAKSLKVEPWEVFIVESEIADSRALRAKIDRLVGQARDEDQLRLIKQLLQAVLH